MNPWRPWREKYARWSREFARDRIRDSLALELRDQPERLLIKAFVCGNGCVQYCEYEGSVDILKLVQLCPAHCRYAVVEWYGQIHVLDVKGDNDLTVRAAQQFPDVDTAIMATQLTY